MEELKSARIAIKTSPEMLCVMLEFSSSKSSMFEQWKARHADEGRRVGALDIIIYLSQKASNQNDIESMVNAVKSINKEVGAAAVASPTVVLELDTYSSSEADPSESSPPPVYVGPMVSPFLCSDDSQSDTEIPKRHVSPTTSTSETPTTPILPAMPAIITPSSEFLLTPIVPHPRFVNDELFLSDSRRTFPLVDFTVLILVGHSASLSTMYPPTTFESSVGDSFFESSVRPSRKRCRSPAATDSVKEDIDLNVLKDIKADAIVVEVAVDKDVEAGIDAGIYMKVNVRIDIKDEVESSDKGTMVVGADMDDGIDIPDGMLMPDAVECLKQRQLEASQLIASGERVSLSDRIRSLEWENLKVRKDCDDTRRRLRSDGNNGNGGNRNGGNRNGGNGNGENGNGGNRNPNENNRGDRHVAKECTYQDFMKCQPLKFKGTKGDVGLTRWFEKMETVFHIGNFLEKYQVKFQELTMLCTKMVLEEEDQIERYFGGLLDNIKGNLMFGEPTRLQNAFRLANSLMDQKLKGYAVKNAKNKRRNKAGNKNGVGEARGKAHVLGGGDANPDSNVVKDEYGFVIRPSLVGLTSRSCEDRPVIRNKAGNKNGVGEARGKAHVLGGGDANPDSNVVKGTFLLNNHYAFVLFDSRVDRSFVSITFSTLLDITLDTLDISYDVKLADRRVSETNTVLRGCILGLLGHLLNIDVMSVELGSFDVIVGMDWLANHHAVIISDEKIM
uniref:Reverse transcriptase domain-containing protein n=1 Tax=Tanacetum cinerariifolium TaxID=118510 RepID=A0A6L2N3I8_TANCI|nr:hypothetical protein [Tanacetum cinerariifolium]